MSSFRLPVLAGAAVFALPLLAACGGAAGPARSSGGAIAVTASDTACQVSKADLPAGKTVFAVTNSGNQTTEVYVYGEQDGGYTKVMGEAEDISPGISRELTVDLAGGTYELACKPGQRGDGIRTRITVAGGALEGAGQQAEAAYDREVEVTATDFALDGLAGFTAKAGEKIEFKLANRGTVEHELEITGPDGAEVGEVSPVRPGSTGEAIVTLAKSGTYRYACGLADHAGRGMTGTFTVN